MWVGRLGILILLIVAICVVLLAFRLTFLSVRQRARKQRNSVSRRNPMVN
jgi:hypothetical protein